MQTDEFAKDLRSAFRIEAEEHVQSLLNKLVSLETAHGDAAAQLIEECFRHLHNLKGSAHAAEFSLVENLCHPLEDVMSEMKIGRLKPSSSNIDLLLAGVCLVEKLIHEETESPPLSDIEEIRLALRHLAKSKSETPAGDSSDSEGNGEEKETQSHIVDTVSILYGENPGQDKAESRRSEVVAANLRAGSRVFQADALKIATDKLDLFMQKAEEMLSLKAMARQNFDTVDGVMNNIEAQCKAWNRAAPDLKQARKLFERMRSVATTSKEQRLWKRMCDILNTQGDFLSIISSNMKQLSRSAGEFSHSTNSSVDTLLDETKRLLMMPCSYIFGSFPLMVRQLGKQLNKEIDFQIEGAEIELDKRILETIKDPLIHIMRNCIDHGIEPKAERAQHKKPQRGRLKITVGHIDGMVEIRVSDDGRGIDTHKVKKAIVKQGLLSAEEIEKLPDQEILRFIFKSSLSTSEAVTEISGRGLGLAIVEEKIRLLGGTIRVDTSLGVGTTFIMRLPLTIATFRGVLVEAAGKTFAVPTTSIDRVVRVDKDEPKPVESIDTILLGNTLVPLFSLEETLSLPPCVGPQKVSPWVTISVLGSDSDRIGFVVDEILEEQEVLVKNLGPVFEGVNCVSGVTILGSGKVVPILNVSYLLETHRKKRTAMRKGAKRQKASTKHAAKKADEQKQLQKRILVVDDALTARMLLRNIFESAGYLVRTANNGQEAFSLLQQHEFDLLITDVEMPKMDGYDLTTRVRADNVLKKIPVIIVTSREKQTDRERGITCGADAFFVKGGLDEVSLVEMAGSLL